MDFVNCRYTISWHLSFHVFRLSSCQEDLRHFSYHPRKVENSLYFCQWHHLRQCHYLIACLPFGVLHTFAISILKTSWQHQYFCHCSSPDCHHVEMIFVISVKLEPLEPATPRGFLPTSMSRSTMVARDCSPNRIN